MFKSSILLSIVASFFCCIGCNTPPAADLKDIQVRYIFKGNTPSDSPSYASTIELINSANSPLSDNWELHFNKGASPVKTENSVGLDIQLINGDYFKIVPEENFRLQPGDTIQFHYSTQTWAIKYSDFPSGFFFVNTDNNMTVKVNNLSISVPEPGSKWIRSDNDLVDIPDAGFYFDINKNSTDIQHFTRTVIPQPKYVSVQDGVVAFNNFNINQNEFFQDEIHYLDAEMKKLLPNLSKGNNNLNIEFSQMPTPESGIDSYELSIAENKVSIKSPSKKGAFYGIASFLQLLNPDQYQKETVTIDKMIIRDYPDLEYRGFMLDVGRNFKSKEQVLWVLDLMSRYKLNTFHFHLTDDEGWRLEIPGLPELTEFGAQRGYSPDESKNLQPSYGSGSDVESSPGSGYFSSSDFVEILQYAKKRHIKVIPEIDLPGHSRAAIKSMDYRYQKYKDSEPDKAIEYLLHDPEDQSEYRSIQNYNDNVVNVCQPSAYRFFEKVVTEIQSYYDKAGAEIEIIHIGGDEVPRGVWTASPACEQWIRENNIPKNQLWSDFLTRIQQILTDKGMIMAGWQEVALDSEHHLDPDKSGQVIPYVWNTMPGDPDSPDDSQELAYKLANNDFKVVISSAPNLYFDFAYDKHPDEPGFYWSGFLDMKKTFTMQPYNIYTSTSVDPFGHPLDQSSAGKTNIEKKENILGIQGQLWSETVSTFSALQYYLVPKAFGLFERAWNASPKWEGKPSSRSFATDWENFRYNIGKYQIPMLKSVYDDKINYRLAPPGGKIEKEQVLANAYWPGVTIKYTTDGSEPDGNSKTYTEPITLSNDFQVIQLKAFDQSGYSSRTVIVEIP
ncbi:family 20 glycosylhydrolase [Membranihabitans maritimus]|uniref:family 20 glycosylhydrolase n=1 Tax=Membranihabitans maritimus TaxID=2904244 RepID=UPI001F44FBAC|nr:family 20 glycosylhydrolase [Membranihabitans maritimus]